MTTRRSPTHEPSPRARGEAGSSLVMVIAFMLFFGIVATSLLSAEWTSERVRPDMVSSRSSRYRGDGAAASAVNWLKANPALGRDLALFPGDLPCVLNLTTSAGVVTATCTGDADSGKLPTGTWPDQTPLQPRVVTILACQRGAARANVMTACDATAGDRLLLRARVRFDVTTDGNNAPASNVPEILSWKHLS